MFVLWYNICRESIFLKKTKCPNQGMIFLTNKTFFVQLSTRVHTALQRGVIWVYSLYRVYIGYIAISLYILLYFPLCPLVLCILYYYILVYAIVYYSIILLYYYVIK